MKRTRLIALFLTLAMLFTTVPALAYNAGSLLPQVKTYQTAFTDTKGTWCDSYVKTVYEVGLMDGKSAVRFDPKGTLTGAQIMVITARLHELLNGGDGKFAAPKSGEEWYQPYLDYLQTLALQDAYEDLSYALYWVEDAPYEPCDRYDFVWLLSAVLPDSALTPINNIAVLPDDSDEDVLAFYNAGILTGTDAYGTFNGLSTLNRGQAAAMLARIVDPAQRVKFTPKAFSYAKELLNLDPAATVLTIDGFDVSAELYASAVSSLISYQEMEASYGCYEKYSQYYDAYMADPDYYDFAQFLLDKYGIDVAEEFAVQWNVPDKAGLTPAEKVRMDALEQMKELAVLFSHQSSYPVTAAQEAEIDLDLAASRSLYYGFSEDFAKLMLTADTLMTNLSKKKAPSASQMNSYLAEYGYFYGRCIEIDYVNEDQGEDSWFTYPTQEEALQLAREARQKAVGNTDDAEYFSYLCWKYSDGSYDEPDMIEISDLSSADQTALKQLSVGGLSSVLQVGDDVSGAYLIFLKDDPSDDEYVQSTIGSIPAQIQLAEWMETAAVVTTEAYQQLDIAVLANRMDAMEIPGES